VGAIRDDHGLSTLYLIKVAAKAAFDCGYISAYHMTIIVYLLYLSN
jgi:hypothetical protein